MVDEDAGRRQAGVSLLFARGSRPDADALARLAAEPAGRERAAGGDRIVSFTISHRPAEHPYWLELLALGLTFDLQGLAPGVPAEAKLPSHAFSLPLEQTRGMEALTLRPGPHLSAGANLLPVIRAMAALGCELACLPGLVAIGWEPARTAMTPDYYRRTVAAWLKGGPFPGLGLSALIRSRDGTVQTDGLTFFIGQEIVIDPARGESPADTAKFALRLIHDLVENGAYSPGPVDGPGGVALHCSLMANRGMLRITRDGSTPP